MTKSALGLKVSSPIKCRIDKTHESAFSSSSPSGPARSRSYSFGLQVLEGVIVVCQLNTFVFGPDSFEGSVLFDDRHAFVEQLEELDSLWVAS